MGTDSGPGHITHQCQTLLTTDTCFSTTRSSSVVFRRRKKIRSQQQIRICNLGSNLDHAMTGRVNAGKMPPADIRLH